MPTRKQPILLARKPVERRAELSAEARAGMLARHEQLIVGYEALRGRLAEHGAAIQSLLEVTQKINSRLDDELEPFLKANTESTQRTEMKIDELIKKSEKLLAVWEDASGTMSFFGRIASIGKNVAWIAFPFVTIYGAWLAFLAWLASESKGRL